MLGIMQDEAETRGDMVENTLLLGQHSWTDEVDVRPTNRRKKSQNFGIFR